jgi:hypothetical protein
VDAGDCPGLRGEIVAGVVNFMVKQNKHLIRLSFWSAMAVI